MPYIHITQNPKETWIPSANPIIFTISTTNTFTKLSYFIDVIINGVVETKLKYPVYDRKHLSIDLNRIVNDFLNTIFVNDFTNFQTVSGETCSLEISVTEEFWDGAQMVYDNLNTVSSERIFVWKSAADFQQQREVWNFYKNFDLMTPTTDYNLYGKFLGVKNFTADVCLNTHPNMHPNVPSAYPVIFNNLYKVSSTTRRTMEFFTASQLTNGSAHTQYMQVWCFDKSFNLTKQFCKMLHNAIYTNTSYTFKIGSIPIGIQELNSLSWDQIRRTIGHLQPYIDPAEDKYYFITVCAPDSFGNIIPNMSNKLPEGLKWVGFEIVNCDKYEVTNVLYKTAEGGWWQIRCDKKHKKEVDIKTNIKHNVWGWEAFTPLPNEASFKKVMHKQANGSITLNTDWINNQGLIDEISEMIKSPEIYLVSEDATPIYTPVLLKDATHQIYDKKQEKLVRYDFIFEEAFQQPTLI